VNEADLHSRHRWLVGATKHSAERIAAWRRKMKLDPLYYDRSLLAGGFGACASGIGSGWCAAPEWWERAKEGKDFGAGAAPTSRATRACT